MPLLIITPLTFLGGTFYSISVLPPFWQTVSLFNPVVYLISGFRWAFYGVSDVNIGISVVATLASSRSASGSSLDVPDRLPAEDVGRTRGPMKLSHLAVTTSVARHRPTGR